MQKFLYQPVSPFVSSQKFGENKACVDYETLRNVITCDGARPPTGYRSLYGMYGHLGIDLRTFRGQPVYCAQRGSVESVDTDARTGLDVKIVTVIGGTKYRHIYEHLLGYQPKIGDYVLTGQLIGWADNTGYSSGDHLHFQLEEWNDRFGWLPIDPLPRMEETFAKDILYINSKIKYLQEQVALLADGIANYLRNRK